MADDNVYAGWWGNGRGMSADNASAVRHAPDDSHYHPAGDDMLGRIGGGGVGRIATIPAANPDGTSKGFDANIAGAVHVDPIADDGGVVVDQTKLSKRMVNAAIASSKYPHEAFYKLGTPATLLGFHKGASAGAVPSSPSIISSGMLNINDNQANTAESALPSLPEVPRMNPIPRVKPSVMPASVRVNDNAQLNQSVSPPALRAEDTATFLLLQQLLGNVSNMQQQLDQQKQVLNETIPARANGNSQPLDLPQLPETLATLPRGVYGSAVATTSRPVMKTAIQEDAPEPVEEVNGYLTLELPFVTGPKPVKAREQVYFDIPGAGRLSARYHMVIDAETCVVLVYDTRFEEGSQYLPPDMNDKPITLEIPGRKKKFVINSVGLAYSCGVFDHLVLIKAGPEEAEE